MYLMPGQNLSPPVRYLLIGAVAVIVLAGVRAAAPIIGPFVFAAFLAMITLPGFRWLERRGMPPLAAMFVIMGAMAVIGLLAAGFLAAVVNQLITALPAYQQQLQEQLRALESMFGSIGIDINSIRPLDLISTGAIVQQLTALAQRLGAIAFDIVLVLIATSFLLLEASQFQYRIERHLGPASPVVTRFRESSSILVNYVIVRTEVNLITGIGVGAFLFALGIDFALLWGLLTFVLSYIPYLGLALAVLPAVVLAWLQFGLLYVVIILVVVSIINAIAENIFFPQMAGHGLNLSPFVVLVSVIFWGWILGGVGIFLAVPLTLAVKMALESWDETRWLGDLLGGGNGIPRRQKEGKKEE
jgi:AI-2 transport protein TqsA